MWNKIANFILKNRFFVLGLIILATVFLGYYAITSLKMENKYGIVLPKDSPTTRNYNLFKEKFGEDGSTFVIAIKTDSLYTEKNFLKWKELGDSILQLDGVESVISEATLFNIKNIKNENRFEIQRIFSDVTFQEKSIEQIEQEVKRNPLYRQILYNDSSTVSLMMVGIDERYLMDMKKSKVVFDIQELAVDKTKEFGEVHYAGLPYLRVILAKRIQKEMYVFVGLSMLVSSLLMYFFFRSFRAVLICMTVVGICVIQALGTIGILGYSLSIMMALIPPLMIVIGIPNCIYLYNKYHQELAAHGNKMKALNRVVSKTGIAMFLTNVTTALGFVTFLFTNSEKFYEFGMISTINIMMCYVVSLCLIPILASFVKNTPERHLKHLDRKLAVGLLDKLVYITAYRRGWVYIITLIITVISGIGMFKMTVTGNITGDLPENDPILKDIHFMEKNFGGAVPFEVMINYKEKGRLFGKSTLQKLEEIQNMMAKDTMFSKTISVVDFVKVINMAYYDNNPAKYEIISNRDKARLSKYIDNFSVTNNNSAFSIKDLVDTTNLILRVRTQMRDVGSYEVSDKVAVVRHRIDSIMNPDKKDIERLYKKIEAGKKEYIDSLLGSYTNIYNGLTAEISNGNADLQLKFDSDYALIKNYYSKPEFNANLRTAIDKEYFDITLTGTSVVASEGTQYLVWNLISSILFAVISIAALMSLLFTSIRMVVVSMIPNLIPMIVTAGIMGWFGIPLKPSTLLIFSIALGITVDNTIHFLARYRQELKYKRWDLKDCIAISIQETGLSIIYTSVILFFGFIVFVFSDFGGTQALGYLSAITYFVALFTNLVLLPCLLLSLERRLTTRSFEEPMFELYDEELDFDLFQLEVRSEDKTTNE
ncbi:MAG: efflux RND transporter permease subunit [Flavobacteriia bacterium]|jgi:predicted RND superfamily exporter protein